MKKILLVVFCIGVTTKTLLAQQGRYDIGLSYGFYQAPNYKQAVNKTFLSADLNYHILKRWTISAGFCNGQFAYFDDYRSNIFSYNDYTNARGHEYHIHLTTAYSIIQSGQFLIQIGSGISQFTQRLSFPFQAPTSYGSPGLPAGTIFMAEISYSTIEVPFKLDAFYQIKDQIGVGIKAGTFLQSNWSLVGTYFGPQIRVRL